MLPTNPSSTDRVCAILIASDRAADGVRPDETTPLLRARLTASGFELLHSEIVPDDRVAIEQRLKRWVKEDVDLIVVSGGTGLSPTDVTPEATLEVIDRRVPGMEEAMRRASQAKTPLAVLSRAVVGTAGRTLIINLPGNPQGAVENFDVVEPVLIHALRLMRGEDPHV